jgi:hypothetical protein
MTRKQRGIKERKRNKKINNPDSSKGRSSKKRKYKDKHERWWMY